MSEIEALSVEVFKTVMPRVRKMHVQDAINFGFFLLGRTNCWVSRSGHVVGSEFADACAVLIDAANSSLEVSNYPPKRPDVLHDKFDADAVGDALLRSGWSNLIYIKQLIVAKNVDFACHAFNNYSSALEAALIDEFPMELKTELHNLDYISSRSLDAPNGTWLFSNSLPFGTPFTEAHFQKYFMAE